MKPTDIDWSKAPEGATHVIDGEFTKWNGGEEIIWRNGQWEPQGRASFSLYDYGSGGVRWSVIPLPTPNACVADWDGAGLPPVGVECEFQPVIGGPWYVVEIIAHFEGSAVFATGDDYPNGCYDGCSHAENFRPLRSQAERERDELASVIFETDFVGEAFIHRLAEAILAKYELKERTK